jgi:hypothetical protein
MSDRSSKALAHPGALDRRGLAGRLLARTDTDRQRTASLIGLQPSRWGI